MPLNLLGLWGSLGDGWWILDTTAALSLYRSALAVSAAPALLELSVNTGARSVRSQLGSYKRRSIEPTEYISQGELYSMRLYILS